MQLCAIICWRVLEHLPATCLQTHPHATNLCIHAQGYWSSYPNIHAVQQLQSARVKAWNLWIYIMGWSVKCLLLHWSEKEIQRAVNNKKYIKWIHYLYNIVSEGNNALTLTYSTNPRCWLPFDLYRAAVKVDVAFDTDDYYSKIWPFAVFAGPLCLPGRVTSSCQ